MSSSIKTWAKNTDQSPSDHINDWSPSQSSGVSDELCDNTYLYVKPLYTRQDTLTLGPIYKDVLENKRREYQNLLKDTKLRLEPDILNKSM